MSESAVDAPTDDPVLASLEAGAADVLPAGRLAEQLASDKPLRVKVGMDPTSADIHLGHCVVLTKLRAFQDAGHTVVLIVGDYTARVGDPSGRDSTRPVLTEEQIEANAQTYQDQAFKVLDPERTEVRHNSEWLEMPSAALFDLVRRFTVARLLERDDFQQRMSDGKAISMLELLYPVLQGYDSVAIDADVELGGSDQKFNLLFGRDVQAAHGQKPQSVLTMPLLVGLDGTRKMSKSYGNYVGVTDDPAEMFGKLMSIPDTLMPEYRLLLLGDSGEPDLTPNLQKRALAAGLVKRFHGADAAEAAEQRFDQVHKRGEVPDDIPESEFDPGADGNVHLPALLATQFGISSSEARRMIGQGGVRIDGEQANPSELDVAANRLDGAILQLGKRRFARLRLGAGS
ncbi:tyrosine--tRNA ligase [soil metagenome]